MVFLWKWILQPEPAWWRSQWLVRAVQPRPSLPRRWSNGFVSCQGSPATFLVTRQCWFRMIPGHPPVSCIPRPLRMTKSSHTWPTKEYTRYQEYFLDFFLFSVIISHGMENRSWNLCWVRSLLHLVELTHKVEWSKVGLTHKEKLGCWDVIGWAQGKCEGKQDEENWDWLIVSSEALVVTPFWLFLFNLPA